jgi:hypothetical protein
MSMGQVAFAEQEIAPGERATDRVRLMLAVSVMAPEGEWVPATIYDLSETGLLMECREQLALGARVQLDDPRLGKCDVEVVWLSGSFYGCRFQRAMNPAIVASAYRSSKVVWPTLREAGPQHRQQVATQPNTRSSLPIQARLVIIVGTSLGLWASVLSVAAAL